MIDLNKIRTMEELEEIKKDLIEFLTDPAVYAVYEAYEWGLEDYLGDRDAVNELLTAVDKRMSSLSRYLAFGSRGKNEHRSASNPSTFSPAVS